MAPDVGLVHHLPALAVAAAQPPAHALVAPRVPALRVRTNPLTGRRRVYLVELFRGTQAALPVAAEEHSAARVEQDVALAAAPIGGAAELWALAVAQIGRLDDGGLLAGAGRAPFGLGPISHWGEHVDLFVSRGGCGVAVCPGRDLVAAGPLGGCASAHISEQWRR